jgi:hypothetical protein
MARKLGIQLVRYLESTSVGAVRKRLGGRATSDPGAGEVVRIVRGTAPDVLGVVLFASGDELHVLTDEVTVRRTSRTHVSPAHGTSSEALASLAADARVFGSLLEGQRVRYVDGASLAEGTLVEKCRYGAIVVRDDRTLMGIGFRMIWPAALAERLEPS